MELSELAAAAKSKVGDGLPNMLSRAAAVGDDAGTGEEAEAEAEVSSVYCRKATMEAEGEPAGPPMTAEANTSPPSRPNEADTAAAAAVGVVEM